MAWKSGLMLVMSTSATAAHLTVSKQLHVTWLSKLVRWKPGFPVEMPGLGAQLMYVFIQPLR